MFGYDLKIDNSGPNPMAMFTAKDFETGVAGHLYPGKPAAKGTGPTAHMEIADDARRRQGAGDRGRRHDRARRLRRRDPAGKLLLRHRPRRQFHRAVRAEEVDRMRRADRLFQIVQYLRGGRLTTARDLAEKLEVSERTIYRDVADLIGSGVPIEGEAGVGYVMRAGYEVPPLMFTRPEVAALVAGARMVRAWGGDELARAAEEALVKIASRSARHLARERRARADPRFQLRRARPRRPRDARPAGSRLQ